MHLVSRGLPAAKALRGALVAYARIGEVRHLLTLNQEYVVMPVLLLVSFWPI